MVWYLLALGVGTLFLFSLMEHGSQVELRYMDLVKLIEQGRPEVNPQAAIEVTGERGRARSEVVRYSNLDNLKFGPHEITGTVTRQVVGPQAEPRKAEDRGRLPHAAHGTGEQQQLPVQLG